MYEINDFNSLIDFINSMNKSKDFNNEVVFITPQEADWLRGDSDFMSAAIHPVVNNPDLTPYILIMDKRIVRVNINDPVVYNELCVQRKNIKVFKTEVRTIKQQQDDQNIFDNALRELGN